MPEVNLSFYHPPWWRSTIWSSTIMVVNQPFYHPPWQVNQPFYHPPWQVNPPFYHPPWQSSTHLFTIHPDRSNNLFIIHYDRVQPTFLSSTMTEFNPPFYHPPRQSSTHLFIIHHDGGLHGARGKGVQGLWEDRQLLTWCCCQDNGPEQVKIQVWWMQTDSKMDWGDSEIAYPPPLHLVTGLYEASKNSRPHNC